MFTFGLNSFGQLGHSDGEVEVRTPVEVPLPEPAIAVAAGWYIYNFSSIPFLPATNREFLQSGILLLPKFFLFRKLLLLICVPLNAHTCLVYAARIGGAVLQEHCVVPYL